MTDANSHTTTYPVRRPEPVFLTTDADGHATNYAYDAVGNELSG